MKSEYIPYIWMIGGVILMILELVMPGLVIIFFGASALIVGLLMWIGLIQNLVISLALWVVFSLVFVLFFRRLALRFFPSESSYQLVEEDVDAIGTVVDVVSDIDDSSNNGRIMFNGTSWQAMSQKGTIKKGQKVRLLYRDNISWVVEACHEDQSHNVD